MTQPFPFIDISGAPFERGQQYGEQARERIHASVEIYGGQLKTLEISQHDRLRAIECYIKIIEEFDADYLQEMRGIAHSSNVLLEDIVMINARTEVIAQARLAQASPGGGCGNSCHRRRRGQP